MIRLGRASRTKLAACLLICCVACVADRKQRSGAKVVSKSKVSAPLAGPSRRRVSSSSPWISGERTPAGQVDAQAPMRASTFFWISVKAGRRCCSPTATRPTQSSSPQLSTDLSGAGARRVPEKHGERAREDKYLELYGIMPTLALLRERFEHWAENLDVRPKQLDLSR